MPLAFAILVGFQLLGEVLRRALALPLPAPLIGMFLLTLVLAARGGAAPAPLRQAAGGLIANMGLLFVPAGVGIVTELGMMRREWLAVLAGLVVSTVLGLAVTGLVMHHVSRIAETRTRRAAPAAAE